MGDERPAGSVTPLVELPCGVRPARNRRGARGIVVARAESSWRARNRRGARGIVVARAESSWRAGCFGAPLRGRWLDGDVWGSVVRPPKWCAHAWQVLVSARGMERAPLARSALADSAV